MNKNNDNNYPDSILGFNKHNNLVTNEGLAERREQLFQKQKDDFTNALVAAIDASNALGLDHSVELLLDSMIDDFCKEELNFSIGTYNNYPASILGVKVNE